MPVFAAEYSDGGCEQFGEGDPGFTLVVSNRGQLDALLRSDPYSAAMGFIRGEFAVRGDLTACIRFHGAASPPGIRYRLFTALAGFAPGRIEAWAQSRSRAARNISFHYDRSYDFYRQFLDSRMVYSCAYFKDRSWNLDQAQLAKLDLICRKLDLQPGDRFLDVGCGWGGLVIHAAASLGATATGCTLSRLQSEHAESAVRAAGLEGRATVRGIDYRDMPGRFNKIASVGMFEHVGRRRLEGYFRHVCGLLEDGGLFLNHGIMRPQRERDRPETLFLQRRVFPGGELAHLSDVIRYAENAGFEVLDVENLRPHYALTCKAWVNNLQTKADECVRLVGAETYRTWLLYLSASAVSFEDGKSDVYQVLMSKRSSKHSPHLTRDYMYH